MPGINVETLVKITSPLPIATRRAWLSVGQFDNLLIHSTPNQHSPLINVLDPVIGLDVWEHANLDKLRSRGAGSSFTKLSYWQCIGQT